MLSKPRSLLCQSRTTLPLSPFNVAAHGGTAGTQGGMCPPRFAGANLHCPLAPSGSGGDVQGEVTLYPTSYTHCYPRTPATGPEPHTELLLQHLLQVTRCIRANSHIQVSKGISPLPKASTVGYKDAPGGSCTSLQHLCGPQYKHTQNYKQRKPHTAQHTQHSNTFLAHKQQTSASLTWHICLKRVLSCWIAGQGVWWSQQKGYQTTLFSKLHLCVRKRPKAPGNCEPQERPCEKGAAGSSADTADVHHRLRISQMCSKHHSDSS